MQKAKARTERFRIYREGGRGIIKLRSILQQRIFLSLHRGLLWNINVDSEAQMAARGAEKHASVKAEKKGSINTA